MRLRFTVGFMLALAAAPLISLQATSVRSPTFEQLVASAEVVVRGRTLAVRTELRPAAPSPVPVTFVTFEVERVLVGEAPARIELEFLGGRVGDDRLLVSGQPRFTVGERDVLFVRGNGRFVTPLVAMGHGRFLVTTDSSGAEVVARANGLPLHDLAESALPLAAATGPLRTLASASAAMRLSEFEQAITQTAAALRPAAPTAR